MRLTAVLLLGLGLALSACAGGSRQAVAPAPSTLVGASPVLTAPEASAAPVTPVETGQPPREAAVAAAAPVPQAVASGRIASLIGQRIGAALDDDDKQRAYAAQVQALESGAAGAPVAWRNPDSGRYGSIVPGPITNNQGQTCRAYTHTITIDGKAQTARGSACKGSEGAWTAAG